MNVQHDGIYSCSRQSAKQFMLRRVTNNFCSNTWQYHGFIAVEASQRNFQKSYPQSYPQAFPQPPVSAHENANSGCNKDQHTCLKMNTLSIKINTLRNKQPGSQSVRSIRTQPVNSLWITFHDLWITCIDLWITCGIRQVLCEFSSVPARTSHFWKQQFPKTLDNKIVLSCAS